MHYCRPNTGHATDLQTTCWNCPHWCFTLTGENWHMCLQFQSCPSDTMSLTKRIIWNITSQKSSINTRGLKESTQWNVCFTCAYACSYLMYLNGGVIWEIKQKLFWSCQQWAEQSTEWHPVCGETQWELEWASSPCITFSWCVWNPQLSRLREKIKKKSTATHKQVYGVQFDHHTELKFYTITSLPRTVMCVAWQKYLFGPLSSLLNNGTVQQGNIPSLNYLLTCDSKNSYHKWREIHLNNTRNNGKKEI